MQLPSDRSAGASTFKRGVVQPWLPEATKLSVDWQMGGHWQPANVRRELPKVRSRPRLAPQLAAFAKSSAYHSSEKPHATQPHGRPGAANHR